jgi:hypothetical protein
MALSSTPDAAKAITSDPLRVKSELAAKRYPGCEWVIANADRFIPYADASFDGVMSITGRLNPSEFRRVLNDIGIAFIAVPAPDDLIEIRGRANRDRVQRTIDMFAPQFKLLHQCRTSTVAELDAEAVGDIRLATYRGTKNAGRNAGAPLVTLSLDVLVFTVA